MLKWFQPSHLSLSSACKSFTNNRFNVNRHLYKFTNIIGINRIQLIFHSLNLVIIIYILCMLMKKFSSFLTSKVSLKNMNLWIILIILPLWCINWLHHPLIKCLSFQHMCWTSPNVKVSHFRLSPNPHFNRYLKSILWWVRKVYCF